MNKGDNRLPFPGKALLWLFLDGDEYEQARGDFEEQYRWHRGHDGPAAARRRFWTMLLKSLPHFAIDHIYWRLDMIRSYLLIAWRNLMKNKGFSFINIVGLTIGLTAFALIFGYIRFELSFDRFHKNGRDLYRVMVDTHEIYMGRDQVAVTPGALAPAMKAEFPEVLRTARLRSETATVERKAQKMMEDGVLCVDPDFLEMFTFPLVSGDPGRVLRTPGSLVLTRETARRYFGRGDPVGQTLVVDKNLMTVEGVVDDPPANSQLRFDFLASFALSPIGRNRGFDSWSGWSYYTYLQLRPGVDAARLEAKLPAFYKRKRPEGHETLRLQPLTAARLYTKANFELRHPTDPQLLYLLSAVGVFLLILAGFNYMNLSTARASRRAKEVGLRKVVGADRRRLIQQFLGESLIFAGLALALSLALARFFLPAFGNYLNQPLRPSGICGLPVLGAMLAVAVLTGLAAGAYPAFVLSAFRPAAVLKSERTASARGFRLRNLLVVMQFVISVTMIFCSMTVYQQLRYIRNKDLGYVKDLVVGVRADGREISVLREKLAANPRILDMAASSRLPVAIGSAVNNAEWEGKKGDGRQVVYWMVVDDHFLDFYRIPVLAGSALTRSSSPMKDFVINQAAARAFGWDDPVGKRFGLGSHEKKEAQGTIVGVVKDFHFASLRLQIEPLAMAILDEKTLETEGGWLSLRLSPEDAAGTMAFIERTWKGLYPERTYSYSFLDDRLDRMYGTERRLGTAFVVFTLVAVLIAGLGLFGLASFTAERKTKEIGIRKVLGADALGVTALLIREHLKLVGIAAVAAWPVGYAVMRGWLGSFAYRTRIGWEVFALSAGLGLAVTIATVGYQSLKAALADPVRSLKYE